MPTLGGGATSGATTGQQTRVPTSIGADPSILTNKNEPVVTANAPVQVHVPRNAPQVPGSNPIQRLPADTPTLAGVVPVVTNTGIKRPYMATDQKIGASPSPQQLAAYAQGKRDLQNVPFWANQPESVKIAAWQMIQRQHIQENKIQASNVQITRDDYHPSAITPDSKFMGAGVPRTMPVDMSPIERLGSAVGPYLDFIPTELGTYQDRTSERPDVGNLFPYVDFSLDLIENLTEGTITAKVIDFGRSFIDQNKATIAKTATETVRIFLENAESLSSTLSHIGIPYETSQELFNEWADFLHKQSVEYGEAASQFGTPFNDGNGKLDTWLEYAYQASNGLISLFDAIAVTAITKSPSMGAGALGLMESTDLYQQMLDAGHSKEKALFFTGLQWSANTASELASLSFMFGGAGGGGLLKKIISSAFVESLQESQQEWTQNLITILGVEGGDPAKKELAMAFQDFLGIVERPLNVLGMEKKFDLNNENSRLWENFFSTFFVTLPSGAIGGGGIEIMINPTSIKTVQKDLVNKFGFTESQAKQFTDNLTRVANETTNTVANAILSASQGKHTTRAELMNDARLSMADKNLIDSAVTKKQTEIYTDLNEAFVASKESEMVTQVGEQVQVYIDKDGQPTTAIDTVFKPTVEGDIVQTQKDTVKVVVPEQQNQVRSDLSISAQKLGGVYNITDGGKFYRVVYNKVENGSKKVGFLSKEFYSKNANINSIEELAEALGAPSGSVEYLGMDMTSKIDSLAIVSQEIYSDLTGKKKKFKGSMTVQQLVDFFTGLDVGIESLEDLNSELKSRGYDEIIIKPQSTQQGDQVDPLIQEAKKYKTVEEFIEAQGEPVYHGSRRVDRAGPISTTGVEHSKTEGTGAYFTNSIEVAKSYFKIPSFGGQDPSGTVTEAYLYLKNPVRIFTEETTWDNLHPELLDAEFPNGDQDRLEGYFDLPFQETGYTTDDIAAAVRRDGTYDGVIFESIDDAGPTLKKGADSISDMTVVFNPEVIKTKQQLIDIWNQAHQGDQVVSNEDIATTPLEELSETLNFKGKIFRGLGQGSDTALMQPGHAWTTNDGTAFTFRNTTVEGGTEIVSRDVELKLWNVDASEDVDIGVADKVELDNIEKQALDKGYDALIFQIETPYDKGLGVEIRFVKDVEAQNQPLKAHRPGDIKNKKAIDENAPQIIKDVIQQVQQENVVQMQPMDVGLSYTQGKITEFTIAGLKEKAFSKSIDVYQMIKTQTGMDYASIERRASDLSPTPSKSAIKEIRDDLQEVINGLDVPGDVRTSMKKDILWKNLTSKAEAISATKAILLKFTKANGPITLASLREEGNMTTRKIKQTEEFRDWANYAEQNLQGKDIRPALFGHHISLTAERVAEFLDGGIGMRTFKTLVLPSYKAAESQKLEQARIAEKVNGFGIGEGTNESRRSSLYAQGKEVKGVTQNEKDLANYIRDQYDSLLPRLNTERAKLGLEEINKHKDYVTHLNEMNIVSELFGGMDRMTVQNRISKRKIQLLEEHPSWDDTRAFSAAKREIEHVQGVEMYIDARQPQFRYAKERMTEWEANPDIIRSFKAYWSQPQDIFIKLKMWLEQKLLKMFYQPMLESFLERVIPSKWLEE